MYYIPYRPGKYPGIKEETIDMISKAIEIAYVPEYKLGELKSFFRRRYRSEYILSGDTSAVLLLMQDKSEYLIDFPNIESKKYCIHEGFIRRSKHNGLVGTISVF